MQSMVEIVVQMVENFFRTGIPADCRTKVRSCRAVVSGGAEGALAPPEFGSSVNPIPTGGGRLCPPHYC